MEEKLHLKVEYIGLDLSTRKVCKMIRLTSTSFIFNCLFWKILIWLFLTKTHDTVSTNLNNFKIQFDPRCEDWETIYWFPLNISRLETFRFLDLELLIFIFKDFDCNRKANWTLNFKNTNAIATLKNSMPSYDVLWRRGKNRRTYIFFIF